MSIGHDMFKFPSRIWCVIRLIENNRLFVLIDNNRCLLYNRTSLVQGVIGRYKKSQMKIPT